MKLKILIVLVLILQGCKDSNLSPKNKNFAQSTLSYDGYKQELTKANDWKRVYYVDGGIYALKHNDTLWEFSKIRKKYRGIVPIDLEHPVERIKHYYLKPKKVILPSDEETISQISVGYNRIYIITNMGILMGLGREIREEVSLAYFSPIDSMGEFRVWKSVTTVGSSEDGECQEHTLGFTEDGTLYGISDKSNEYFEYIHKLFPKKMGKEWTQVLMGCYTDYAMKNDGTFWKWGVVYDSPVRVEDKELIDRIRIKMQALNRPLSSYNIDLSIDYEKKNNQGILPNGTLWLLPNIE